MGDNHMIRYYCFNKKCNSSIFSKKCIVSVIAINTTLATQYCQNCNQELVSKEELNIKIQLSHILNKEKSLTVFIIDDDPIYHAVVKKLFEHSTTFHNPEHYIDAPGALDYLAAHKNDDSLIPDVIFVDVNMPDMDAWSFLDAFAGIYPMLNKTIDIYVMTSILNPLYESYIRPHPYVKDIISKDFDLSFLNSFTV